MNIFLMCGTGFMRKQRQVINSGQDIEFKKKTQAYH